MSWKDLRSDDEPVARTISADTIMDAIASQLPDWLHCPSCGFNEIELAEDRYRLVCPRCDRSRIINGTKENRGGATR
jgi:ssDNA-binding Zn-finger/Zn-ribbon topoisomerase 1